VGDQQEQERSEPVLRISKVDPLLMSIENTNSLRLNKKPTAICLNANL
jgi:hypothetical protein